MAVMTSVKICNLALKRLGQENIGDLQASDPLSSLCNQFYEPIRQELEMSFEWSFAISRAILAPVTGDTLNKYGYKYQLPVSPKCLKVLTLINVADETYEDLEVEWTIEGLELFTDQTPAAIKFIKDVTQVVELPLLFIKAFALRLAMEMCIKLTQDQQLFQFIAQEFALVNENAKQQIGSSGKQTTPPNDWW